MPRELPVTSATLAPSPVTDQSFAIDERGPARTQPGHGLGELEGCGHTSKRDRRDQLLHRRTVAPGVGVEQRRVRTSRTDDVDAHTPWARLQSGQLRQRTDAP